MKTKEVLKPGTVYDLLKQVASDFGMKNALQIQRGYRKERWSYNKLLDFAERSASLLASKGVKRGDRLIIWAPNIPEWVGVFFGCLRAGIILVPLDVLCTAEFVTKIVKKTSAKCVCISKSIHTIPELNIPILYLESLPSIIKHVEPDPTIPHCNPGDIAEIMFTSGTTGEPKGVILTHSNIVSNVLAATQVVYARPNSRALSLLPLSHMLEQTACLLGFLRFGSLIVFPTSRQPMIVLRTLREERITNIVVVPQILGIFWNAIENEVIKQKKESIWSRLLQLAAHLPFSLRKLLFWPLIRKLGGHLHLFICGGSYLDPNLACKWELLGIAVVQGYGTTEAAPIVTVNPLHKRKMDSVGKILSGQELRINSDGEILIRGPNVTPGYWSDSKATAEAFEADWYKTGDIGYVDKDRYLYLRGRKKDMIPLPSGMNVFPDDIEEILRARPEVKDACVLGIPSQRDELEVQAVLLLKNPGVALDNVIQQVNSKLAEYQRIKTSIVWPFDEFPLTNTLKIKKHEVQKYIIERSAKIPSYVRSTAVKSSKASIVHTLLMGLTNKPIQRILSSMTLGEDLNLDSLNRVELLSAVESEMGVYVDESFISAKTTVEELESLISSSPEASKKRVEPGWSLNKLVNMGRLLAQSLVVFPFLSIVVSLKVEGRDNLKNLTTPVLLAANHQSHFDTPVVLASLTFQLRRRLTVAAAADFWFNMGPIRELLATSVFNAFPFSRTDSIRPSLEHCGRLIDNGWSILIYPEGTRSLTGQMGSFKSGVGLMAVELGIPIIPIHISGTYQLLPKGKTIPQRGDVKVKIGTALCFDKETEYSSATQTLEETITKLGVE